MTDILDINLGTAEQNGKDGDTTRVALGKVNTNFAALNAGKLDSSGGSLSGSLTVVSTQANATAELAVDAPAGTTGAVQFKKAGSYRWGLWNDGGNESGNNHGSDLRLVSYNDQGGYLGTPMIISRYNSQFQWYGPLYLGGDTEITGNASVDKSLHVGAAATFGGAVQVSGNLTMGDGNAQYGLGLNGSDVVHLQYQSAGVNRWDLISFTDKALYLTRYVDGVGQGNAWRTDNGTGQTTFQVRPRWGDTDPNQTGPWVTPWDSGNLTTPLDASNPVAAQSSLKQGLVILGSVTIAAGSEVATFDNFKNLFDPSRFDSYELVCRNVKVNGTSGAASTYLLLGLQYTSNAGAAWLSDSYVQGQISLPYGGAASAATPAGYQDNNGSVHNLISIAPFAIPTTINVEMYSLGAGEVTSHKSEAFGVGNGPTYNAAINFGHYTGATTAKTGFRITVRSQSGTSTGFSGIFTLYGLRKNV